MRLLCRHTPASPRDGRVDAIFPANEATTLSIAATAAGRQLIFDTGNVHHVTFQFGLQDSTAFRGLGEPRNNFYYNSRLSPDQSSFDMQSLDLEPF